MSGREWAEQAHFQHANFLAASQQFFDDFFTGANRRAHQNNDAFCLRMAVIFKWLVLATRSRGEVVHRLFDVIVNRVVPRVGRFA